MKKIIPIPCRDLDVSVDLLTSYLEDVAKKLDSIKEIKISLSNCWKDVVLRDINNEAYNTIKIFCKNRKITLTSFISYLIDEMKKEYNL